MADWIATLAADTLAIGPDGRGITLPAGMYPICHFDGTPAGVLYLLDPADSQRIVGCVDAASVTVAGADR